VTKSIRELIVEAQRAFRIYKNPGVSEAAERINELIVAAGLGNISKDRLEGISIDEGFVTVSVGYSVRGCIQSDDYEFPEMILDEEEPVKAARLWGQQKRLAEKQEALAKARETLAQCELEYAEALASAGGVAAEESASFSVSHR
jgi:hypothetical protein